MSGSNSAVECQLPKLDVAGSIPVSRSSRVICCNHDWKSGEPIPGRRQVPMLPWSKFSRSTRSIIRNSGKRSGELDNRNGIFRLPALGMLCVWRIRRNSRTGEERKGSDLLQDSPAIPEGVRIPEWQGTVSAKGFLNPLKSRIQSRWSEARGIQFFARLKTNEFCVQTMPQI